MRIYAGMLATFLLSTASLTVNAGEYDFKPGLWETTTKIKIEGVPKAMAALMAPPAPITETGCTTEKDIIFNSDSECKYDTNRISSKKVRMKMTCSSPNGAAKGKGEINFNGKKLNGWFEMNSRGPSGPMKIKHTFTAKYVGTCK